MSVFNIFAEKSLESYLIEKKEEIKAILNEKTDDELSKINKKGFISDLVDKFKIDVILDFDNIDICVEDVAGTNYFIYKIPFTGNDIEYFKLKPNNRIIWSTNVYLENNNLQFEVRDDDKDIERIEHEANDVITKIKQQTDHVNKPINQYNDSLPAFIEDEYNKRKYKIFGRKEEKLKILKENLNKRI